MPFSIKRPDNLPIGSADRDRRQERPKPSPPIPRSTPLETIPIGDVRVTCIDGRVFQLVVGAGVLMIVERDLRDGSSPFLNYIVDVYQGDHIVFAGED